MVSSPIAPDVPDKIGQLCAKYDKDGNGKYSLEECAPHGSPLPTPAWR